MLFYSNLVLFYSNLIASHLTSSLLTSSHLIYLSHLILSIYLILSHLIWSYLTLSDLICFYLMLYHAISCYLMLSHLIYLILFFLFYLVWFIHLIHLIYLIWLIHLIHLILSDLNVDLNLNLIYQASNQSTCLYTPTYLHAFLYYELWSSLPRDSAVFQLPQGALALRLVLDLDETLVRSHGGFEVQDLSDSDGWNFKKNYDFGG
jgi:hypothetical protein